ncbi:MAG: ABC transporter substrate-binding protein [Spirochaetes bacterium]|nr:ABC transporter substrate-binding protein [Spirochaetota bacterium]
MIKKASKFFKIVLVLLVSLGLAGCTRRVVIYNWEDFEPTGRARRIEIHNWEGFKPIGRDEWLARANYAPPPQDQPLLESIVARPDRRGGTFHIANIGDVRTFNLVVGTREADSGGLLGNLMTPLTYFCPVTREQLPWAAESWEITELENGGVKILYTLRDDLFWTYLDGRQVPVTSDDFIFWYDTINGNPAFNTIAGPGQWVLMPDGTSVRTTIHRVSDRQFYFIRPQPHWNLPWATNETVGPRHIYEPLYVKGGVAAVNAAFTIAHDPRLIPSMGPFHIVEYMPGQRITLQRNPGFFDSDSIHIEHIVVHIIPELATQWLMFRSGQLDAIGARPEDLIDMIVGQSSAVTGWTAFSNRGNSATGTLWTFNQNSVNRGTPQYEWFNRREFRQAMSSLVNRERIASQVSRGLAVPTSSFRAISHPHFNPDIVLPWDFCLDRAVKLLESIDIRRDDQGVMRDWEGRPIEFTLAIPAAVAATSDTAIIIASTAAQIGINITVSPLDFQLLVNQLTETFDWQSLIIGVTQPSLPGSGTNVWQSHGNLHMWYPFQETPVNEWTRRKDYLFNAESREMNPVRRQEISDEFERLLQEEMPLIYLNRGIAFLAVNNRWDMTNFFFDASAATIVTSLGGFGQSSPTAIPRMWLRKGGE